MLYYVIEFINSYGHIIKRINIAENKSLIQVKRQAKKEKFLYPECYIEILDMINRKRIYA